jgi:hypothetical protein
MWTVFDMRDEAHSNSKADRRNLAPKSPFARENGDYPTSGEPFTGKQSNLDEIPIHGS